MSERVTVIHALGSRAGICNGSFGTDAHWWRNCVQPQNGTIVDCGSCGRMGILPDAGHVGELITRYLGYLGWEVTTTC